VTPLLGVTTLGSSLGGGSGGPTKWRGVFDPVPEGDWEESDWDDDDEEEDGEYSFGDGDEPDWSHLWASKATSPPRDEPRATAAAARPPPIPLPSRPSRTDASAARPKATASVATCASAKPCEVWIGPPRAAPTRAISASSTPASRRPTEYSTRETLASASTRENISRRRGADTRPAAATACDQPAGQPMASAVDQGDTITPPYKADSMAEREAARKAKKEAADERSFEAQRKAAGVPAINRASWRPAVTDLARIDPASFSRAQAEMEDKAAVDAKAVVDAAGGDAARRAARHEVRYSDEAQLMAQLHARLTTAEEEEDDPDGSLDDDEWMMDAWRIDRAALQADETAMEAALGTQWREEAAREADDWAAEQQAAKGASEGTSLAQQRQRRESPGAAPGGNRLGVTASPASVAKGGAVGGRRRPPPLPERASRER